MVNIVAKLPQGRDRGAQSDARRRLATGIGALLGAFRLSESPASCRTPLRSRLYRWR